MNAITIRLGTRHSALATAQAGHMADRLRELGHTVEMVEITTLGDTSTRSLAIGGTGVFASAIRKALLAGEIDIAVHSLKDLPVAPEPGLRIAAIPVREDARDALVARDGLTLGELPAGSVVGTGSPRRAAQLARPWARASTWSTIRGNVGTRISLVHNGSCDAVLLARAGLARLGRLDEATESLDPLQMLPAPGQGALAIECREDRPDLIAAWRRCDDPDTRACVSAERALLAALEAGCTAPIGALADVVEGEHGTELFLRAFAGSEDASIELRRSSVGPIEPDASAGTWPPSAQGRRRRHRPDRGRSRPAGAAERSTAADTPSDVPSTPIPYGAFLVSSTRHHTEQPSTTRRRSHRQARQPRRLRRRRSW